MIIVLRLSYALKMKNQQSGEEGGVSFSVGAGMPNSGGVLISANSPSATSNALSTMSTNPGGSGSSRSAVIAVNTPNGAFAASNISNNLSANNGNASFSSFSSSSSNTAITSTSPASTAVLPSASPAPVSLLDPLPQPPLISSTLKDYTTKTANITFSPMSMQNIIDFSVSRNGELAVLTSNTIDMTTKLYFYDYANNNFYSYVNLNTIIKISLAPDGTVYFIDSSNKNFIFYIKNSSLQKIPVCANAMNFGKDGQLYVIECQQGQIMQVVAQLGYTNITSNFHLYDGLTFNTINLNGFGTKIDTLLDGSPIVISTNSQLMYYSQTSSNWQPFFGIYAQDFSVANSGLVFIIATNGSIFALNYNASKPIIYTIAGSGVKIDSGPNNLPYILTSDNYVLSPYQNFV